MNVSDFDYDLPPELIAQVPAAERTAARLLVLDRRSGARTHSTVSSLPAFLARGDLVVVNDTRVFPARLLGSRVPSGGAVECLLTARVDPSTPRPLHPSTLPQAQGGPGRGRGTTSSGSPAATPSADGDRWEALVHPGQKLKPGAKVRFEGPGVVLWGEILERRFFGRREIRLWREDGGSVDEAVDRIGHVPLPPYIRRADEPADRERYQTVYARSRGSVAAPTAGLHLSEALLDDLRARGVERASITLHVGYGTFKPVRAERVEEHTIDPEWIEIGEAAAAAINRAKREHRRIVAVGTTTTRALESAVDQAGQLQASARPTTLFIYPGFTFRVVDALLTNFHLPRSSLLMLVAAFAGRDPVMAAYRDAVASRYRFYSYGDAMLIV